VEQSKSLHAWGIAIDVAKKPRVGSTCLFPDCGPYPGTQRSVLPARPDARVVTVFQNHGFHWDVFFDGFTDAAHFQWATGV